MERMVPFRKASTHEFTEAQEKFWSILQEPTNRGLPLRTLCQKVGYRSTGPWYGALQDEAFRARMKELGIVTQRRRAGMIIALTEQVDEEWQQTVVDMRRLVAEYPKHLQATAFTLDFSCISNPSLNKLVKRYFRARVGFWEATTFKVRLAGMKPFFMALSKQYPEMETFASLTREMIEPLLALPTWTDKRGRTRTISAETKMRMVSGLNSLFSYMHRHAWEGAPTHILLYIEANVYLAHPQFK